MAVNPATDRLYVANSGNNTVTVIRTDTNAVVATVTLPAGSQPQSVAVNAAANKIYTANNGTGNVTVIDGETNGILVHIGGFIKPAALAVNPLTHKVFLACDDATATWVGVIDGTTQGVLTIPSGGTSPVDIAIDFYNKKFYVLHFDSNNVREAIHGIDINLGAGAGPTSTTLDPTASRLYVAESGPDRLTIIDSTNDTILNRRPVGDFPVAVRANPVTHRVYVVNRDSDNVTVVDGNTFATTNVPVGDQPGAIDVNAYTNKVYVVNHNSNSVTVIDGATNATSTIGPYGGAGLSDVAVNPVTNRIYVTAYNHNWIIIIDGTTNTASILGLAGALNPRRVAVNPVTNKIYVTDWGSNQVSIIDGATNTVVNRPSMGTNPRALAVNIATNKVYIINEGINTLTVIDGVRDFPVASGLALGGGALAAFPLGEDAVTVNRTSSTLTAIDSQHRINPLKLDTTIEELPRHTAYGATVRFNFTANSLYAPTTPPVRQIYFQVDTMTGPWRRATPDGASASGSTPSLTRGLHFVYAFAVDGQEATSVNTGRQSSPIPGRLNTYGYEFLVTEARAHLPIIMR